LKAYGKNEKEEIVLFRKCRDSIGKEVEGKGKFLQGTPREAKESGDQG
jgi:hypothetical protein